MARLDFALLIEQYQNEDGVAFEFLTDVGDIDDFHVAEEIRITVVGHLKRVRDSFYHVYECDQGYPDQDFLV